MKRISFSAMVVLMLMSAITSGYSSYVPYRFRTRSSPYAFSYKHPSGLISGELKSSPYAFSHNNPSGLAPYYLRSSPYAFSFENPSGLIPDYYRYSPYAFSFKHQSGLISDYSSGYFIPYDYHIYYPGVVFSGSMDCSMNCGSNPCSYSVSDRLDTAGFSYGQTSTVRNGRTAGAAEYANRMNMLREKDGMQIICSYFKNNSIDGFEMDRLFKVENKTVSVNFIFRDKNIIIKYWNPEEVRSILQQPGCKKVYYEQYKLQWMDFCKKHEENGGKIYQIESADKDEILSKLSLCQELAKG